MVRDVVVLGVQWVVGDEDAGSVVVANYHPVVPVRVGAGDFLQHNRWQTLVDVGFKLVDVSSEVGVVEAEVTRVVFHGEHGGYFAFGVLDYAGDFGLSFLYTPVLQNHLQHGGSAPVALLLMIIRHIINVCRSPLNRANLR